MGQVARVEAMLAPRVPAPLRTEALGAALDGQAIVRAALAISGASDLSDLLLRVMQTLMQVAGATHGCLLMEDQGRLILAARAPAGEAEVSAPDVAASAPTDLAWSVVRAVHRAGTPVVLVDGAADPVFGSDPWLATRRSRSVLCAPVTNGARPVGVVYLENRLAPSAFTAARVDMVRVIATLAASLVDNARLVRDLEGVTTALRESHGRLRDHSRALEQTVSDRTRALADVNTDLRLVLETVSEGILRLDPEGRVIWANPAATALAGRPVGGLTGHRLEDLLDGADGLVANSRTPTGDPAPPTEMLLTRPDGSAHPVERTVRPIRGQGTASGTVVTLRDVGERAQMAEQLRHAQKMEAVGRLAGGVAHEFNNLLTALLGHLSLLEMTGPTAAQARPLRSALQAGHRAADLVRHMLALGRRAEIRRRSMDITALAEEVISFLRPTLDRGIELRWAPPAGGHWVLADPGQLHQVLLNLCLNARDAVLHRSAADGSPGPWIQVTVASAGGADPPPTLPPGRYVLITVLDNGVGMDAATRARAFEPFFTTKDVGLGSGLGLSVVDGILSQHGGAITCESGPARGRARPDAAAPAAARGRARAPGGRRGSRARGGPGHAGARGIRGGGGGQRARGAGPLCGGALRHRSGAAGPVDARNVR